MSYKHRGVSERPTGVEPATGGLEGRCSSIELRTRIGGPTWTRTRNNAFGERRLDQLKRFARKRDARVERARVSQPGLSRPRLPVPPASLNPRSVAPEGVEPPCPSGRRGLSALRLPVPPRGHVCVERESNPQALRHGALNAARMPVPPSTQKCAERDLNPHALRHQALNLARIPVPPSAQGSFVGGSRFVRPIAELVGLNRP